MRMNWILIVCTEHSKKDKERKIYEWRYPSNATIPMKQVEWKNNGKTLIRTPFPLMISWAITIHKSQGRTLELAVIHLGTSETCCGMPLVSGCTITCEEYQHHLS